MEPTRANRRLSAILMADVVGYSRLMGADEEATVSTLRAYREVFTETIPNFNGRVVDAKGDALMAEFAAVTEAVACAVEIQRELAERNSGLPAERRMDFRIGINLGEVLVEGDEIFGDGINVAARLEGLAEPGGITVSGAVYDAVKGKLGLEFQSLGAQKVKNIADPVRTFRVLSKPGAAAHRVVRAGRLGERKGKIIGFVGAAAIVAAFIAVGVYYLQPTGEPADTADLKTGPSVSDRPSIAVLAFKNLSGDPEQEYFADGFSEDIITSLSKIKRMRVIARESTFRYKNQPLDVRDVGRELGVRYVLEGSIRKVGDRVRINAQLIDASDGSHIWAETYDRVMTDVFAIQDEIKNKIVTELDVMLTEGEQIRAWRRGTENIEAYETMIKGYELFLQQTPE
ncbi:MAG: adenylate/guanylate cyclase domain-containing protein, partial [SAR324 cluster bacterium]|nr:adenylate/guanylate cyclase domain-containing protein [SAR324 cluster bacterium]